MAAKRAVLIGCNYPGTKAELKGCINDVRRMHRSLLDRYGFPAENIAVLIDTEGPPAAQPTGRNILNALSDLVAAAKPGDVLFVHYSGHGTRLPAETGEDDDTGYDECIVPTDMNLITDDDFRELVDKVPEGCRITIVSDSCHSGGLIDEAKEQIGESTKQAFGFKNFLCRSVEEVIESHQRRRHNHEEEEGNYKGQGYFKSKSLPLSTLIELLKQKTDSDDIDAGNLRPTLFHIFGNDATPKVKKFVEVIMAKVQSYDRKEDGLLGKVGGLAIQFLQQKLDETVTSSHEASKKPLPDSGILISGCQSDETSADASPSGNTSEAYGALSNAIQEIIAEAGGGVSNREVVVMARKLLRRQGFTQRPGLYCSDEHVDAPFVC